MQDSTQSHAHYDGLKRAAALFVDTGPCWVCDSDRLTRFHEAVVDLSAYRAQDPELAVYTGTTVAFRRCEACGFGQPAVLPTLPRFFERMYDQQWSPEWIEREFESSYKNRIFRRILYVLNTRVVGGRRTLLDVGAHAGRFLQLARGAGWTPAGIEPNARTAAYAARRTGIDVRQMGAQELGGLRGRYDAVTLIDVLEHIPDPVTILALARTKLAPNGWIAVKVPNGPAQRLKESVRAWLKKGYRARLGDNLVHVNHFSPKSLRLALERAGFDAVHIEPGVPECPPGQDAGNAVRLLFYWIARLLPFGVRTPVALNLQAYARNPPLT